MSWAKRSDWIWPAPIVDSFLRAHFQRDTCPPFCQRIQSTWAWDALASSDWDALEPDACHGKCRRVRFGNRIKRCRPTRTIPFAGHPNRCPVHLGTSPQSCRTSLRRRIPWWTSCCSPRSSLDALSVPSSRDNSWHETCALRDRKSPVCP